MHGFLHRGVEWAAVNIRGPNGRLSMERGCALPNTALRTGFGPAWVASFKLHIDELGFTRGRSA